MGRTQTWRMDASLCGATRSAWFTSNQTHVAFTKSGSVYVGKLDSARIYERRCASLRPHSFGLSPILALSPLRTNLLAISIGSRTCIWDVESDKLRHTFHASERSVTSSAWSNHNPDLLAIGHLDGHVSVWNLSHPQTPNVVWAAGAAQCHLLSWSTATPSILLACCGQTVNVWDESGLVENSANRFELDYHVDQVLWRSQSDSFVAIFPDASFEEYSTAGGNVSPTESTLFPDQDLFGGLEDMQPYRATPMSRGNLPPYSQILTLGENAILSLAPHGRSLHLYKDFQCAENNDSLWNKQLMGRFEHLIALPDHDAISIVSAGFQGLESVTLPAVICEQLGNVSSSSNEGKIVHQLAAEHATLESKSSSKMRPSPIPTNTSSLDKRKQSIQHRLDLRSPSYVRPATAPQHSKNTKTHSAVSPRQAMASSLELPKFDDEESPMPFLSPTIPSQRLSPSTIPVLGDDITLPPPETESFGSLTSTAVNDSDSDDETFNGDALKGSGTLMMPGAANVPLPKSCGAFFSPNGQLITYFPPKARVKAAEIDGLSSSQPEERSTKASRLFPLFGNLAIEARDYEDSDTESDSSQSDNTSHGSPKAGMFSFSTPGDRSWSERLENLQALPRLATGQQTVIVSVRDVNELIHFRPTLARNYKLSCASDEAAGQASIENADIARTAGLHDLANVWSLLGLLLQGQMPEELMSIADTDILTATRRASRLVRANSGTRPNSARQSSSMLVPQSAQSKIGASWIVSQIFAWTERRADVQMLACMSAVLLSSTQSAVRSNKAHVAMTDSRSSLAGADYFVEGANHNSHRPTPVLNADTRDGTYQHHSPAKPTPRSSHVSSRDPSQPTTPYIDSLSSTPPFPFPKLSREGPRLSASGSASPETHRSSFGAAAKYYAQSITDKISSYGTSPPARRFGTSPNNELSTSLPGAGSWSKSVSFASGVDFSSRNGTRTAPEDDGYDSDRTIEDTSLPHTPKGSGGPVLFTLKNSTAFLQLKDPQLPAQPQPNTLLSPLLAAKARIWIGHYTEQLRRMGLQIEAAELDNIAGHHKRQSGEPRRKHAGVTAVPATIARKATCSICYCKIQGVQQVCSQCLHTMHLECFSGFMEACGGEEMECPAGCGCACSMIPYNEVSWAASEGLLPKPPAVRRKRSFTDPSRWREEVQGDSW